MDETPVVEKRRVEMVNAIATPDGVMEHKAVDYVPVDLLEAYVADARGNWQVVMVGDEHDPGPGGGDGLTHYPAHLDHPLAGTTWHHPSGEQVHDVEAFHAARAASKPKRGR